MPKDLVVNKTVSLPISYWAFLSELADKEGTSISKLIKYAIEYTFFGLNGLKEDLERYRKFLEQAKKERREGEEK